MANLTIVENPRITDVLFYEAGEAVNYVRDAVLVESGTAASTVGQVLGKVTATGKFTQLAPGASDGSQNAAGILLGIFPAALTADTTYVAITRGPSAVKLNGLQWTAGMTGTQITAAIAQLLALGIKVESDFGV